MVGISCFGVALVVVMWWASVVLGLMGYFVVVMAVEKKNK